MRNTLERISTRFSASRREFLGGAMSLAGILGYDNVKRVTAQEATAAVESVDDYVWVAPEWGEERSLFQVIERGEETATVETADGRFEVPSSPERLITLDEEYVPLFELGIVQNIVGIGETSSSGELDRAGDLTEDLHASLEGIPSMGTAWELDAELVLNQEPDLILGNISYQPDEIYAVLTEAAPFIRKPTRVVDAPRAAVRDLGALFGLEEKATQLTSEHEAYVARAHEAVAPFIKDKRVLIGNYIPESNEFFACVSHYIRGGGISTIFYGYPFFRELDFTPTSFVELLSEQEDRAMHYLLFSFEEYGNVDADMVFYIGDGENRSQFDEFLENPVVQTTPAFRNDAIYLYDANSHGYGLAGVRSSVKWIVETLTNEPFE